MDILSDQNLLELKFTPESKSQLATIAQWANINAIVGLISLAISVAVSVKNLMTMTRYADSTSSSFIAGGGIIGLIITITLSLLLNITLLNAANNIKKGLASEHQATFNFGIRKFKTYYQILGILLIILLIFIFLVFLVMMFAGGGSRY